MSNVEERLLKLEISHENMQQNLKKMTDAINENSTKLATILSNTESLDKILKYVVTPLIAIVGAIVGFKVVLP